MTITRLAVFDCDGTLSDGQAAVCNAMEATFEAVGLEKPARNAVRRIVGLSLPVAIAQLAPDEEPELHAHAVMTYKHFYGEARRQGMVQEPLFEGIADLVARLHASGWTLGVATGKSDRGLALTLAAHGISHHFSTLQTADRHPSKPHPAMLLAAMTDAMALPEQTVMIGDTSFDIDMARAAGVRALGVSWGYHPAEELLAAGAQAVADSAAQLEELLHA
jgi:phosphoglycolate phosphatase